MKIRNLLLVGSFLFLAAYVSISFRNLTPTVIPGTITPISPKPTNTIMPPTQTPQPAGADRVKIFLIAVGDNGVSGKQIGCGDSLVPIDIAISPTHYQSEYRQPRSHYQSCWNALHCWGLR